MRRIVFRYFLVLRENYWFWPAVMTLCALVLGFLLPFVDSLIGPEWTRAIGFLSATHVEGARAILTTLAGSTLGVAGVAFSITIVAVSFASANYGPRLIGNFMGDRTNQVVLGVFVSTFVYCITVLTAVHSQAEFEQKTLDSFVPQVSILVALVMTLLSVGALIIYIHHIPDSINIMNLTSKIGLKLRSSIVSMLEDEADADAPETVDVTAWRRGFEPNLDTVVRARSAGFLQQLDLRALRDLARERHIQIAVDRSAGNFLAVDEHLMTVRSRHALDDEILSQIHECYSIGAERTDVQDVLFLSDQLVEVLMRALSPGVNDPHTAILCLDWLRVGLVAFASLTPMQPAGPDDPLLYRRITFEIMLDQSFDRMRQYVSTDRNATLHALEVLADVAAAACRRQMVEACRRQMQRLATSAGEQLSEQLARAEVEAALAEALRRSAARLG